jgi:SAM-dependent methyltransferase
VETPQHRLRHRGSGRRRAGAGLVLVLLVPLAASGCGRAGDTEKEIPLPPHAPGEPDVGFISTHDRVVDRMLELAEVRPDDVVYDLGCGDGRIVIAAAKKYGARAVGIEIDPKVVERARENVKKNQVEHLVTIRQGDIFEEDFHDATVVALYLLPQLNVRLMPKLAQLRPGARIVSHNFGMKGARPEKVERLLGQKIYLWRVPWKGE